jgi:hypothetical protein
MIGPSGLLLIVFHLFIDLVFVMDANTMEFIYMNVDLWLVIYS